MIHYKETKFLPYKCLDMFQLVMDVSSYPHFLPWCQKAQVIQKTEDLMRADLWVGSGELIKSYRSLIHFKEPFEIRVTQEEGPFKLLHNLWVFKEKGPAACQVDFEIEFSFRSRTLALLMEGVFEKVSRKMVSAFEERAHTLYKGT